MARQLATLIWMFCNLMTMVAGVQLLPSMPGDNALPLIFGLTFCSTLIHELGHAAAAVGLGAVIREFSVWGVTYIFADKRLSTRGGRSKEVAGHVRYNSPPSRQLTLAEHAVIAAAGQTANLVTALIALGVGHLQPGTVTQGTLTIFAILSAGMMVSNLVPFTGSDGYILREYLRRRR